MFALKRVKSISNYKAVKIAYHALFELRVRDGIVVSESTPANNLQRVFVLQKRILQIMARLTSRESCREVFKEWKIATVPAAYSLEVVTFAIKQNIL